MKKLVSIVLILGTCFASSAQNHFNQNWLFGYQCGLDFSTDPPQPIPDVTLYSDESCASISDSAGNFLFSTNGITVWNKNHDVMDNGTGLCIGQYLSNNYGTSVSQGVVIIPSITNTHQYLIFTQNAWIDTGIRISTVDMSYNGGLGEVISKNQITYQGIYFSEKLAACKHANGRDWWIISLELGAVDYTNYYHVLLYSPQGTQFHHVDTVGDPVGSMGQMVFSPNGKYMGLAGVGRVEILNFDRCTGDLSLNTDFSYAPNQVFNSNVYYGACFSGNGNFFYVTPLYGQILLQYSLDTISNEFTSADTVWYSTSIDTMSEPNICTRLFLGQMQLGPDDKIYCSFSPDCTNPTQWDNYAHNISVINNPNLSGTACDFQPASVFVGDAPHYLLLGLPNMPNYNLGALHGSPCDTITSSHPPSHSHSFKLFPSPNDGNFTLVVDPNEAGHLSIAITDLLGRVILTKSLVNGQAVYSVQAGLPSGSYQCIVLNGNHKIDTIPFIVINE